MKVIKYEDEGAQVWLKKRGNTYQANRSQLRVNHPDGKTYICGENERIYLHNDGNIRVLRYMRGKIELPNFEEKIQRYRNNFKAVDDKVKQEKADDEAMKLGIFTS